nr:unnamed protein product [Callosobruchus analis]
MDDNTPVLENYYLRPDSQIYTTQLFSDYYMVKAVHKTSQTNKIVQVDVGKWIRSAKKFATFEAISIYRDRSDLMGLELNMTYVATSNETLNHLEDYRFIHIDPLTKVNWITVGHLLNMLNITPIIKWEKTWGYLNPQTNVFSGMLGDLQTGVSELAGTQCFYTDDRIDYVDFVPASTPTYFKFIFSTDTEPKSISGRIATLITLLALMFLYTSYSANIVALLQSTTESIKTLEDILNSRITLGVHDVVYGHYYFEHATEPTRRAIYEQKVAPKGQKPHFMTVEEGIARVRKEFFGFSGEVSSSYKIVADTFEEHEKCSLKEVIFITPVDTHMPIRKKSAYKEFVKVG